MVRRDPRPPAQRQVRLEPLRQECVSCGERLWVAYHARRTLMTLQGLVQLTLVVRRCRNQDCPLYHQPYRPEEEGGCRAAPWRVWVGYHHHDRSVALWGASQCPRDPSAVGEAEA